jgi:hypothetical protein
MALEMANLGRPTHTGDSLKNIAIVAPSVADALRVFPVYDSTASAAEERQLPQNTHIAYRHTWLRDFRRIQ